MKTSILIVAVIQFFILTSCNTKGKPSADESINENVVNFDWLLGSWERKGEEQGTETFENWKKISESEYSGIGFTIQDGDTVKQEKIKLIKQNGKWDLIVKVPDEAESVLFKMTTFDAGSFTCENDSLDFPKLIKYWKYNGNLKAVVSGDDMEISFEFEKMK